MKTRLLRVYLKDKNPFESAVILIHLLLQWLLLEVELFEAVLS